MKITVNMVSVTPDKKDFVNTNHSLGTNSAFCLSLMILRGPLPAKLDIINHVVVF